MCKTRSLVCTSHFLAVRAPTARIVAFTYIPKHMLHHHKYSGIIRTDGLVLVPPGVPGLPLRTPTLGLLMELADHGNLRDRIYKAMGHGHRAYSDAQAADWLLSLAEALAFLHGSNPTVIHRDVKAENVLLQSEAAAGPAGGAGAAAGVGGGGGGRLVAKLADLGLHVVGVHAWVSVGGGGGVRWRGAVSWAS